ncbi:MAG: hypothetical protein MZV63_20290 [Marinilabiliales bacterium]|nr:hypothetical protein [Marinilabiliales bacterium]
MKREEGSPVPAAVQNPNGIAYRLDGGAGEHHLCWRTVAHNPAASL